MENFKKRKIAKGKETEDIKRKNYNCTLRSTAEDAGGIWKIKDLFTPRRVHYSLNTSAIKDIIVNKIKKTACEDFIYRKLFELSNLKYSNFFCLAEPTQYVLERREIKLSEEFVALSLKIDSRECFEEDDVLQDVINELFVLIEEKDLLQHVNCVEDQVILRQMVLNRGIAFIANGSFLARAGTSEDKPLHIGVIPFTSPPNLEEEFLLPNHGIVRGMLIPRGVTVVTGGCFHGKSTLLRALASGAGNKIPGDGREFVVTDASTCSIRAEDGRVVTGIDISPFISTLPAATGIQPSFFQSLSCSGSTSQAASVMEALEARSSLLLMDEDTSAANFMTRDSRMRAMISHEPVTPFIYRVNSLFNQLGVSTILVVGACGDWFDVQDLTLMLDDYHCLDVTAKAKSISNTFCHGRVQYNGRGLVHRLEWPWTYTTPTRRPTLTQPLTIALAECMAAGEGNVSGERIAVEVSEDGNKLSIANSHVLDLSRMCALVSGQAAARGIGFALRWILLRLYVSHSSVNHKHVSNTNGDPEDQDTPAGSTELQGDGIETIATLILDLETELDKNGVSGIAFGDLRCAQRPRPIDVAAAVYRFKGITFEVE